LRVDVGAVLARHTDWAFKGMLYQARSKWSSCL